MGCRAGLGSTKPLRLRGTVCSGKERIVSLRKQPLGPIPENTKQIASRAFKKGNPYIKIADELGDIYDFADFVDLFPRKGQPAEHPVRLVLVTILQFAEALSDREAAEAVRGRIDWKYLL